MSRGAIQVRFVPERRYERGRTFISSDGVSRGMRQIYTETEIDAPPSTVWTILTDFDAYDEWNPLVIDADGRAAVGERLTIRVQSTGRRPSTMPARVTVADPERTLEWVGGSRVPGLFSGRHTLELEPLDDGRTRLVNRERATGLLVPFVVPRDIEADYEAMNRALAERAAARSAARSGPPT